MSRGCRCRKTPVRSLEPLHSRQVCNCQGTGHEGNHVRIRCARGAGCRGTDAHWHSATTPRGRQAPNGTNPPRRDLPGARWETERGGERPRQRHRVRRQGGYSRRNVAARVTTSIGHRVRHHTSDSAAHPSRRARREPCCRSWFQPEVLPCPGNVALTSPPRGDVTRIIHAPSSFGVGQVGRVGPYRYGKPIRDCLPGVPSATGLPSERDMDHVRRLRCTCFPYRGVAA